MLFSVIVPVYNKEKVLIKAINSVLNQTFKNFEVIIVDDGSTDNSVEELKKFIRMNNVTVVTQKNQGVSVARNTGIQYAKGECITFLDPDDEWKHNHLETLNKIYFKLGKAKGLYCTSYDISMYDGSIVQVFEETTKRIIKKNEYEVIENIFNIYNQYKFAPLHTNSIMIPKSIFSEVGYFTVGCKKSQDTDMWFRVLLKYPAILIGATTTIYHREESTATATQTRNFEWPFFSTADSVINSKELNGDLENSLIVFIDQLRISMTKHLLMEGKKKEAKIMINKVRQKRQYINQYILLGLIWLIHPKIIKSYYYKKNINFLANQKKQYK